MPRKFTEKNNRLLPPPGPGGRRLGFPLLFLASFGVGFLAAGIVLVAQRSSSGKAPAAPAASPAEFDRFFQRGTKSLAAERHAEAFQEFTRAAQLDPTDPRPHYGLAKVYQSLFLTEQAEQAYRKALQIDPDYYPAKLALATILYDFSKHEEALAVLKNAEKQNPTDPFLWAEIALNQLRLGNHAAAIHLLEKYNAASGNQAWGRTHLARALAEAGQAEAAERTYRESLAINPKMAITHFWLGQLLFALGRKAEADPEFKAYQDLRGLENQEHSLKMGLLRDPTNAGYLVNLARVRYLLGKPREALSALEKARELAPGDPRIQNMREELRRALENPGPTSRPEK